MLAQINCCQQMRSSLWPRLPLRTIETLEARPGPRPAPLVPVRPCRPKADLFRDDASARRRPKADFAGRPQSRPQSRPGPALARAWTGPCACPAPARPWRVGGIFYIGVLFGYLFGGFLLYGGFLLAPIGPYWLLLAPISRHDIFQSKRDSYAYHTFS